MVVVSVVVDVSSEGTFGAGPDERFEHELVDASRARLDARAAVEDDLPVAARALADLEDAVLVESSTTGGGEGFNPPVFADFVAALVAGDGPPGRISGSLHG